MTFLLTLLWFIRTSKTALFYFYLWQLKEYQVKRFIDHFRTFKGRVLFLNNLNFLKVALVLIFLFFFFIRSSLQEDVFGTFFFLFALATIFLYFIEAFFVLKNIFKKKLKRPVLTKKIIVLILTGLIVEILFFIFCFLKFENIGFLAFAFLLFDILAPLIFSLIVLIFQPLTVLIRLFVIRKAKEKIRKHKNLLVIGITGSFGKTSTKEFLADILSSKFKVLKTKENQNSEMGISRCILKNLKKEHEVFVVEMGAYRKGGIKLLADIIKPKIGILTGINEQHLALFGSQETIIKTKYELIESLLPTTFGTKVVGGLAIFNGNNKYCLELYKITGIPKEIFTTVKPSPEAGLKPDIWAEDIKIDKEAVSFRAITKEGERADFKIKALGKQAVSNILGAALAAKKIGMTLDEISEACQKIENKKRIIKLIKGREGVNVIDSSYSANPDGVLADLSYLNIWERKKVIIMPCLIELGKASKKVHQRIGKKIAEVCDLAIITTRDYFKEIKEEALKAGMEEKNIVLIENPQEINNKIEAFCVSGDTILLEGRVSKEVIDFLEK